MNCEHPAEEATLGALILCPMAPAAAEQWLRASDFADPWHAEVYRVLRDHAHDDALPTPTEVGLRVRDRLGPVRADLPRFAELVAHTPANPQPLAYAALVLGDSARRAVASMGVIVRAGAAAAAAAGEPTPLTAVTGNIRELIGEYQDRLSLANRDLSATNMPGLGWRLQEHVDPGRPVRPTPADSGADPATSSTAQQRAGSAHPLPDAGRTTLTVLALGADRYLRQRPVVPPAEVITRERLLLGCLINQPEQIGQVQRWLEPEMLADPCHAAALQAIRSMAATGESIDPVTVAHRASITADFRTGGGVAHRNHLSVADLAQWADGALGLDVVHAVPLVAGDVLCRQADRAAQELLGLSRGGWDPGALLERATAVIDRVESLAVGLNPQALVLAQTSTGPDARVVVDLRSTPLAPARPGRTARALRSAAAIQPGPAIGL